MQIPHDTALYRQPHKIEIMFGRLKDWRRIHSRYGAIDRAVCGTLRQTGGKRQRLARLTSPARYGINIAPPQDFPLRLGKKSRISVSDAFVGLGWCHAEAA